jgi:Holliday junction resolvasome RuvABC endonuclease subunit
MATGKRDGLIVAGLDPGLRTTGFGLARVDPDAGEVIDVLDIGVIDTLPSNLRSVRKTSDDFRRAKEYSTKLRNILDRAAVDFVAAEMQSTTPYLLPTFSFGVTTGVLASPGHRGSGLRSQIGIDREYQRDEA